MENMEQNPAPANGGAKETLNKVLSVAKQKGAQALLAIKPFVDKLKALPKKVWIGIGAGVAALIVAIIVIAALSNTPTTPIKLYINTLNNKKASKAVTLNLEQYNGFLEKEYKEILKLQKKSDEGKENLEEQEEYAEEEIEDLKDKYGDNYKVSYKVIEKEKLDKDDLKEAKERLKSRGKSLRNQVENTEDWDSDDWADAADEMGLTKSQAKSYYKIMKKIGDTLYKAKVTEGYEITVEIKITGSELDEPEVEEETFFVYKVNGRWVLGGTVGIYN